MPCYEGLNSCFLFISVVSLDVCLATIAQYLTTPFFGPYVRVLPETKKHRQRVMVCGDRRPPKSRICIPPLWISIECYYHIDARRVLANASAVASSSFPWAFERNRLYATSWNRAIYFNSPCTWKFLDCSLLQQESRSFACLKSQIRSNSSWRI